MEHVKTLGFGVAGIAVVFAVAWVVVNTPIDVVMACLVLATVYPVGMALREILRP